MAILLVMCGRCLDNGPRLVAHIRCQQMHMHICYAARVLTHVWPHNTHTSMRSQEPLTCGTGSGAAAWYAHNMCVCLPAAWRLAGDGSWLVLGALV
eukprot:scaffold24900_cov132-Isochrysis_galbana.AAC.6